MYSTLCSGRFRLLWGGSTSPSSPLCRSRASTRSTRSLRGTGRPWIECRPSGLARRNARSDKRRTDLEDDSRDGRKDAAIGLQSLRGALRDAAQNGDSERTAKCASVDHHDHGSPVRIPHRRRGTVCSTGRAELGPLPGAGLCAVLGDILACSLPCGGSDLLCHRPEDRALSPPPIADSAVQVVAEHAARPEATEPLLTVRNLRVEFPTALGDSRVVLRGISFSLLPGEIVGVVGESGAGKTTLARALLGLP